MTQRPPEQHILEDAWSQVVGGMDWLKSVFFGEFSDHRPLSAVAADMLVSFIPGVVIVTSARDAVAVILRLASHPEKREELMEWVLLSACLIVIALPVAMAAGGAAAAGVGAIVGGLAGSELGAALRAVMLMLIKEASKLVELILFLQKFIKGDILKFLRSIQFAKYEKPLMQAMNNIIGKLVGISKALHTHLKSLQYFDSVKATIVTLVEWEKRFYAVQQDALKQVPKALAELDARLAKVVAQTAPKEAHTAVAGVRADNTLAALPAKQRVKDTPGASVAMVVDSTSAARMKPEIKPRAKTQPKEPSKAPSISLKDKPAPIKLPDERTNTKKQAVTDPIVDADRARITQLSKEGKVVEARAVLQPYVDAAKSAKNPAEKKAAMEEIIQRLDVSSNKDKMFWSGNKELARAIAKTKGKTILEETPGGKVADGWDELNRIFSWDIKDMKPHGWDLWGEISANYSKDAAGEIDIIQDIGKFPAGGDTWRQKEWPTIVNEGKVVSMNIYGMDNAGNILQTMKTTPDSVVAEKLFGGK
mgnify:CR=1 FL=1